MDALVRNIHAANLVARRWRQTRPSFEWPSETVCSLLRVVFIAIVVRRPVMSLSLSIIDFHVPASWPLTTLSTKAADEG
jgi:hypothetical protein